MLLHLDLYLYRRVGLPITMHPYPISSTRLTSVNRSENELSALYARVKHTASVGIPLSKSSLALVICAGTRSQTSGPARAPAISPSCVPFGS